MHFTLSDSQRTRIIRSLNGVMALCGISAVVLLVLLIGWPLSEADRALARMATQAVLALFVVEESVRFLVQEDRRDYFRGRFMEISLAAAAAIELLWGEPLLHWLGERTTSLPAATITVFYLAGTQLTLVVPIGLKALRKNNLLSSKRLSPGMVFILSFAALILVGTLLLKTPQATVSGGIGWVDSLFISTSAVCVTGLSTVDVETVFTRHGQWIVLSLIQVGGLGVMTITYFFAYFFAGGVTLRNRIALQDLLSEESLGQVGTVLGVIIGFTFIIELAGALAIHSALLAGGVYRDDLFFFSLFHSISAFCNAGFSTLGNGLSDASLSGQTPFFTIIMLLIVAGGIGFPVMKNAWLVMLAHLRVKLRLREAIPPRLTANSRMVLVTTVLLLGGGTGMIWLTEFFFGNGQINGNEFFTALFHSVTARTAGFNIVPNENLLPATAACIMMLMFIGGSPASTAGGIKTTTLAVAVLALRRVLFGRTDIEAFGRRLPEDTANRALAIILLSVGFITMITVALCVLHPELSPADLTFEAVSAVSTVGLSRGITSHLGDEAKLVLVAAMFIGRIGVLVFLLSFIRNRTPLGYRLPETSVVLT